MLKKKNTAKFLASIVLILFVSLSTILPLGTSQINTNFPSKMPDRDTVTTVGVSPTLIGLNQELLINVLVYPGPVGPTYEGQSLVPTLVGGYRDVTVTITQPDGSKETFKPADITIAHQGINIPGLTQIVGHLMFYYTPKTVGTYSISSSFPGQTYTTAPISDTINMTVYYKPSTSASATQFVVQQDPVSGGIMDGSPWQPLPTNYWEDPVQTNNREWYAISGDWVQDNYNTQASNYNPYSQAPGSPHILWRRAITAGGLLGGEWGSLPYDQSGLYWNQQAFTLDGKIYRNSNEKTGYFECIDARTGEKLWQAPGSISGAARMAVQFQTSSQVNQGGIKSWLWGGLPTGVFAAGGSTWTRYSTFNGEVLQSITNAPTDVNSVKFSDGSPIVYVIQMNGALWNTTVPLKLPYVNLIKWNFTKMVSTVAGFIQTYSSDWRDGVEWNVSVIQDDAVSYGDNRWRGVTVYPYPDANVVICREANSMQTMAGFDATTGAKLWKNNATVLSIDILTTDTSTSPSGPHLIRDGASNNFVAYDVKTGKELYRMSTGELPWALVNSYSTVYHNGTFYYGSQDGYVYAYKDGNLVWKSDFIGNSSENIQGTSPVNGWGVGAAGKLFFASQTDYALMPRTRFLPLVSYEEATGKMLWKLPIEIKPTSISSGTLLGEDANNGFIYAIGKGQTTTTVSAPNIGVTNGQSVMITGTVMDQSPGKPNIPAIADQDMSEWMDYIYGQNATLINNPPTPKGVDVTLSVIDSNGNMRNIGTATSDYKGFFSFNWTPDIEGKYAVYASFPGSESYWPSSGVTAFTVESADTTPAPTQLPQSNLVTTSDLLMYLAVGVIAIIIAIAIVGLLLLKKRP